MLLLITCLLFFITALVLVILRATQPEARYAWLVAAGGLGPLIGTRTWGGVIGIWPRHKLADGTETTQPEYSFWFKDVGWQVENYGTDPDIEVELRPQDYAAAQQGPSAQTMIRENFNLVLYDQDGEELASIPVDPMPSTEAAAAAGGVSVRAISRLYRQAPPRQ